MGGKGGLFRPPRHKWLAKIVCFRTPRCAKKAAKTLLRGLERGRIGDMEIGPKRALTIVKALHYAANRATAAAKRENLSAKERRELKAVAKIYRKAAKAASRIYKQKYK